MLTRPTTPAAKAARAKRIREMMDMADLGCVGCLLMMDVQCVVDGLRRGGRCRASMIWKVGT